MKGRNAILLPSLLNQVVVVVVVFACLFLVVVVVVVVVVVFIFTLSAAPFVYFGSEWLLAFVVFAEKSCTN